MTNCETVHPGVCQLDDLRVQGVVLGLDLSGGPMEKVPLWFGPGQFTWMSRGFSHAIQNVKPVSGTDIFQERTATGDIPFTFSTPMTWYVIRRT